MNFFRRIFGLQPPTPEPEPDWRPVPCAVDPDLMRAVRTKVAAALKALPQRQLEEERRKRELEREQEEAHRREAAEAAGRGTEKPESPRVFWELGCDPEDMAKVRAAVRHYYGLHQNPETFARSLVRAVKSVYGANPVPFYTAAGLDRSTYSKLISHPDRHPSKDTMLAMSAALKMDVPAAEKFLNSAGYSLSDSIPSDIVWSACFALGIHYLPQIRQLLAEFDLPE